LEADNAGLSQMKNAFTSLFLSPIFILIFFKFPALSGLAYFERGTWQFSDFPKRVVGSLMASLELQDLPNSSKKEDQESNKEQESLTKEFTEEKYFGDVRLEKVTSQSILLIGRMNPVLMTKTI
jgi:hypothetical protein